MEQENRELTSRVQRLETFEEDNKNLRQENTELKDENADLKSKIAELETRLNREARKVIKDGLYNKLSIRTK